MHAARLLPTLLALLPILVQPALAQRQIPFMDQFRKLMEVHAQDEMGALIKKN